MRIIRLTAGSKVELSRSRNTTWNIVQKESKSTAIHIPRAITTISSAPRAIKNAFENPMNTLFFSTTTAKTKSSEPMMSAARPRFITVTVRARTSFMWESSLSLKKGSVS